MENISFIICDVRCICNSAVMADQLNNKIPQKNIIIIIMLLIPNINKSFENWPNALKLQLRGRLELMNLCFNVRALTYSYCFKISSDHNN